MVTHQSVTGLLSVRAVIRPASPISLFSPTSLSILTPIPGFQRSFLLIFPAPVCSSDADFSTFSIPLSKSLFQLVAPLSGFRNSLLQLHPSLPAALFRPLQVALPNSAVLLFLSVSESIQPSHLVYILRSSSMQHR